MNKLLGGGTKRHPATGAVCKDLQLADVNVGEYLTTKYGLWIDFRSVADNSLHGTGRPIMNANNGITLQIKKTAETAGVLNSYLYVGPILWTRSILRTPKNTWSFPLLIIFEC